MLRVVTCSCRSMGPAEVYRGGERLLQGISRFLSNGLSGVVCHLCPYCCSVATVFVLVGPYQ